MMAALRRFFADIPSLIAQRADYWREREAFWDARMAAFSVEDADEESRDWAWANLAHAWSGFCAACWESFRPKS